MSADVGGNIKTRWKIFRILITHTGNIFGHAPKVITMEDTRCQLAMYQLFQHFLVFRPAERTIRCETHVVGLIFHVLHFCVFHFMLFPSDCKKKHSPSTVRFSIFFSLLKNVFSNYVCIFVFFSFFNSLPLIFVPFSFSLEARVGYPLFPTKQKRIQNQTSCGHFFVPRFRSPCPLCFHFLHICGWSLFCSFFTFFSLSFCVYFSYFPFSNLFSCFCTLFFAFIF